MYALLDAGSYGGNALYNTAALLFSLTVSYLASLAIYRLYFSPLAKIPGPKIAGIFQP